MVCFFINGTLQSIGFTRTNDANAVAARGVGNQEQTILLRVAQNNFALFVYRMIGIVQNVAMGIEEDRFGFVKVNAVLAKIASGFGGVSFKLKMRRKHCFLGGN
jgi:hypothetical protein